jgi:hypothetical protein
MCELAAVTVGMPENTRKALVASFEKDGPASLPDLLAEIAKIKGVMEPKTAGEVFSQMERPAPTEVSQEASDFVEGVSPTPITKDQWEELTQQIKTLGIPHEALKAYCIKKDWLPAKAQGFNALAASCWTTLQHQISPAKITAFIAHLNAYHGLQKSA